MCVCDTNTCSKYSRRKIDWLERQGPRANCSILQTQIVNTNSLIHTHAHTNRELSRRNPTKRYMEQRFSWEVRGYWRHVKAVCVWRKSTWIRTKNGAVRSKFHTLKGSIRLHRNKITALADKVKTGGTNQRTSERKWGMESEEWWTWRN